MNKNLIKIAGIAFLGTATVVGYLRYKNVKKMIAENQEEVVEIVEESTDEDSRK